MRSDPQKLASEAEVYAAALRALARRAHSIHEMHAYLERRAVTSEVTKRVLARLRQENLLDDGRYALAFARQHANTRRQGPHRIARELRRRGVPDCHVEAALDQVFAETDEALLLSKVVERRLRAIRAPLDQRRIASLYRALLRAGFDSALVRRALRSARTDVAPLPETPEPPIASEES